MRDLKNKIFVLLDSLGGSGQVGIQPNVDYMSTLYCTVHRGKKHMDWSRYVFLKRCENEKQINEVDCWVHICAYSRMISHAITTEEIGDIGAFGDVIRQELINETEKKIPSYP